MLSVVPVFLACTMSSPAATFSYIGSKSPAKATVLFRSAVMDFWGRVMAFLYKYLFVFHLKKKCKERMVLETLAKLLSP